MHRSNRSSPTRGASFLTRLLAFVSFLLFCLCAPAFAQGTTGSIAGTVLDEAQGNYLEGAEISVDGTALRTTSERGGAFVLSNVPAGTQSITVKYPGMSPVKETVVVNAGDTARVSTKLTSEVIQLAEYSVKSNREGMSQAIAIQKISIQSKMVAASDQFGPVSEGNVGEYLKFLPGVTVDYNVNDARGLSLRGLSTAFTVVAVDGTPMAGTSSMDDTRRFEFEQIAMNNVETTELFKTVTPDIPANSTGGFVNFVTKSAFDHQDQSRLTYDLSLSAPSTNLSLSKQGGVWGHKKQYTMRPSLEANYSRKVTEKFGVNFNYRLSEKYDDSPRTTATWNTASSATAPTIFTAPPRLLNYAVRTEQKLTHREAFATKLDYKLSDATKATVSGQWNWYDLNFTQRGPTFGLGTNAIANGLTYSSSTGTGAAGPSVTNGVLYRNKYGTTIHVNGTLEHEFSSKSKASLTTYWSRADGHYRDTTKGFISVAAVMNPTNAPFTGISITDLSKELPTIGLTGSGASVVSMDLVRSLANYTLSTALSGTVIQSRPWTAVDKKKGVSGNYTYDLDELSMPLKLEAGFAIDTVRRDISRPDLRGSITATTGAALTALADPLYTKDVAFGFGSYQAFDPFKVWDTYKNNLTVLSLNDVRQFEEDNSAVYLRGDLSVTPDFLLIGGVRWEQRDIDAQAQSKSNVRSKLAKVGLGYDQYYPSLTFKYTPGFSRNLVLRGGYSRTVGHPDYADLLPSIISESTTNAHDGTITVPDPDLKPYFSKNFDLSADYYLKNSGVLSVYGFRKDVKNYFISRGMTGADISAIATDYGYNPAEFVSGAVTTNGGKSTLSGVELSYAQNLTFLPKPFDGLNVQVNFTRVNVSTSDPDAQKAIDTKYSQLRAVSPKTFNFILGYRYKDFSLTTTTNWVSESLFGGFVATSFFTGTVGTATLPDTRLALYRDEKVTTDVKFEYAINKHVSAYFLVRNIFNSQRMDYYRGYMPQNQGVVLPNNRYEFGEPHLTLGVRGRF